MMAEFEIHQSKNRILQADADNEGNGSGKAKIVFPAIQPRSGLKLAIVGTKRRLGGVLFSRQIDFRKLVLKRNSLPLLPPSNIFCTSCLLARPPAYSPLKLGARSRIELHSHHLWTCLTKLPGSLSDEAANVCSESNRPSDCSLPAKRARNR